MSDRILLVDDDPATVPLPSRILAPAGQLHFATCGADAGFLSMQCRRPATARERAAPRPHP